MPYKIFTHDHRSPIQGSVTTWDGTVPFTLPSVRLDTSSAQCAAGWNYVEDLSTGFRIAGLWPNGWSALAVEIEPSKDAIKRGDKSRASELTITRVVEDAEIRSAIDQLSRSFDDYADYMAAEQWAWFEALRRPRHRNREVERALRRALKARDLGWGTRKYEDARDAWDAWDAWAAWDALAAWDARDALDARDAWDARDALAAWDARAAWAAWDARDARAARDALTVDYASTRGWVDLSPKLITTGLREAYANGLAVALPVASGELGWAMTDRQGS